MYNILQKHPTPVSNLSVLGKKVPTVRKNTHTLATWETARASFQNPLPIFIFFGKIEKKLLSNNSLYSSQFFSTWKNQPNRAEYILSYLSNSLEVEGRGEEYEVGQSFQ